MEKHKIGKSKKIALIAHDKRKGDLLKWVEDTKEVLKNHNLCGTGTTAKLISEKTGLEVYRYKSGPLGGDIQISADIVNKEVDMMIFFWDPLTSQPHDPDIKALLRIGVLFNTPIAMNKSTADFLVTSDNFRDEYVKDNIDYYGRIEKLVYSNINF